ncbi:MAG: hypothetical protein JWO80_5288 [Bryobacterales bacterium]|nr:hypothetical protein [Bryobacterales bacterium]
MLQSFKPVSSSSRLLYLDWVRGIAAIIMLQGHVFNSFTRQDLRNGGPYQLSQFVGGMPPAIFLFLTGVTLAFLMDSTERKGLSPGRRVWAALNRAGFLLGIAFLFRIQLWAFSSARQWSDLLRVDILNCMGFAIAVASVMALFPTSERIRLCAVLGVAIAAAAPLVSQIDFSGVPAVVRDYLAPNPNFFGFFPWAAFLAFGVSFGSLLRTLKDEQIGHAMQWVAMGGTALAFAAYTMSSMSLSIYSKVDFWLNSPALILIKLGVMLMGVAFAYLWTLQSGVQGWSWVRQFGTTSLLVYWVHIELVYGRWLGFWKENLTIGETIVAAFGITLLMLALSIAKTTFPSWKAWLVPTPSVPKSISGD